MKNEHETMNSNEEEKRRSYGQMEHARLGHSREPVLDI